MPNDRYSYDPEIYVGRVSFDYDVLEILLTAIFDAINGDAPESARKTAISNAYKALTGRKRSRVDWPDSEMAQNMFQALLRLRENMDHQIRPEFGGPVINTPEDEEKYRERTLYAIAKEFYPEGDPALDGFYKRLSATYNSDAIKRDPDHYFDGQLSWAWDYNKGSEEALYSDMARIAGILSKYGLPMSLDRAFWRMHSAKPNSTTEDDL